MCEGQEEELLLLQRSATGTTVYNRSITQLAMLPVAVWCGVSVVLALFLCCSKLDGARFSGIYGNNRGDYTVLP